MSSESDAPERLLFVDSCAVNGFALANVDPTKALAGSPFRVAYTPGLAGEYRQALAHRRVEPHIKALLRRLLEHGLTYAAEGIAPEEATDTTLVALSRHAFVVTRDRKPPWDRAAGNRGLLVWSDVERVLRNGATLADLLQSKLAGT